MAKKCTPDKILTPMLLSRRSIHFLLNCSAGASLSEPAPSPSKNMIFFSPFFSHRSPATLSLWAIFSAWPFLYTYIIIRPFTLMEPFSPRDWPFYLRGAPSGGWCGLCQLWLNCCYFLRQFYQTCPEHVSGAWAKRKTERSDPKIGWLGGGSPSGNGAGSGGYRIRLERGAAFSPAPLTCSGHVM